MRHTLVGNNTDWHRVTPLNRARCDKARWRIVELCSVDGLPFRGRLTWSTGEDSDLKAMVLVPRGTRVCIYAADIVVEAMSATVDDNHILCTVADGYAVTQNQFEWQFLALDGGPVEVLIPPFATFCRVDCADASQLPTIEIRVYDGQNNARAHLFGPQQPYPGLPLGEARRITVTAPGGLLLRATFLLSL